VGCVWFYHVDEALRLSGLKRKNPIHKKELFFSVHYDEPGHAEDILLRKVKVIFFGKHPDLTNPNVIRAIDEADYFCAQTYHFQQKKIEDNELAKNTGGQMRRMFGRLGKLIVDGDVLASGGAAAAAAAAAAAKKAKVKKEKTSDAALDIDLVEDDEEVEPPRKEPEVVTGKRRAAAQAELAIKKTLAKEDVIDVDGDVVMQGADESGAGGAGEDEEDAAHTDNAPMEDEEDDIEYEVEDVLDDRVMEGRRQFLIRWKGYDASFDTWQDCDDCSNCPDIVKAYITRRYHSYPDKLLSVLSSFKRAKPVQPAASSINGPNLLNLPPDVRFFSRH
jgi:hypothetical protein